MRFTGVQAVQLRPLPLLILDLNGTLVFRGGGDPVRRPYLGAFLAYALGAQIDSSAPHQRKLQWEQWDREQALGPKHAGAKPHGSMFWPVSVSHIKTSNAGAWKSHALEPTPSATAVCRALIWSSAQEHNVGKMARTILAPSQAQHILRVWARETLVPQSWIDANVSSVKDLEIVWDALNVRTDASVEQPEGEKRVLGQYRFETDSSVDAMANLTANVSLSKVSTGEREDKVYGQHNTLLLDDSPEKARLQPFNHILLPEFDASRAKAVQDWRAARRANPGAALGRIDNVLLQLVGVLEHARWERNVSAWIRTGGLGFFGGMKHPDMGELKPEQSSKNNKTEGHRSLEPRLNTPYAQRTQHFWAQEGKNALKAAGIAAEIDS